MNLKEIQRGYDVIYNLGGWCDVPGNLVRKSLRRCAGPLDWILVPSLSVVCSMISDKFSHYFRKENMIEIGRTGTGHVVEDKELSVDFKAPTYTIVDRSTGCSSLHDFAIVPDASWEKQYPQFRERINRRVDRFYNHLANSNSMLFIWSGGPPNLSVSQGYLHEALNFIKIMTTLTKSEIVLLILNTSPSYNGVEEVDWGYSNICTVNMPCAKTSHIAFDTSHFHDYILEGVYLY